MQAAALEHAGCSLRACRLRPCCSKGSGPMQQLDTCNSLDSLAHYRCRRAAWLRSSKGCCATSPSTRLPASIHRHLHIHVQYTCMYSPASPRDHGPRPPPKPLARGCSLRYARPQPLSRTVTYGCSLSHLRLQARRDYGCIRLQPLSPTVAGPSFLRLHTVAASLTYGCRPVALSADPYVVQLNDFISETEMAAFK